ncbi:MAG: L,D-transpeptidase family protein [Pseudomonadales bacterium]|nr:L,D-transpeptidase family protein [Pseudomonadales bacterium]
MIGTVASMLSSLIYAQAGSAPPIIIESATAFYDSLPLNTVVSGGSGFAHAAVRPKGVIKLPRDEPYLLWVELNEGRMHLLEQQPDGGLITRKIIPVSIGKNGHGKQLEGDKRTPVGVYRFTRFLADQDLIDFYGLGAYPINYPNAQDRLLAHTGSGIWLHGLPKNLDERPFLDSDGCVIIDNDSLQEMAAYIDTGVTHIILSEDAIEWQPISDAQRPSLPLEAAFMAWKQSWEARDNEAYLAYYADDFSDLKRNKASWDSYKRQVNNSKSVISVGVSKLSFLADPQQADTVTVRYFQKYHSNNYNWSGWKEQLWRLRDDSWQIIYEGNG